MSNNHTGNPAADTQSLLSFREDPHPLTRIKKVIGVVSGKGGVGKSLVTSLLAVMMQREGYMTGIMDADITGPSIPRVFGVHDKAKSNGSGIYPEYSQTGIAMMSLNLLVENENDPVVWRGPVIAGVVKQFWTEVMWGDLDVLFVDLPPGTGDVPLTVFQSLPLDGIIVVTSPQDLVSMIVGKAIKMAQMMNIPILGLVENMSYVLCPDCGKRIHLFGESKLDSVAADYGIATIDRLPIEPSWAAQCDSGTIEAIAGTVLDAIVAQIQGLL